MPRAIGEVVEGCRESWGQAIELVWAWNLVVLAIWLESLDPLPTCAIEGEKEGGKWCFLVYLTPKRVHAVPLPFDRCAWVSNGFPFCVAQMPFIF